MGELIFNGLIFQSWKRFPVWSENRRVCFHMPWPSGPERVGGLMLLSVPVLLLG